jgi:hypothetical protein
MNSLMGHQIP